MAELRLPLDEQTVRNLKVGEGVELTGRMITGRDAAHKWLLEGYRQEVAPFLEGTVIYHCGPVVRQQEDGSYEFVAAGPTTSIREEPYQADVIERYRLRGVIGKGGMGQRTLAGLEKSGALYLHAVGGAAQAVKRLCIVGVKGHRYHVDAVGEFRHDVPLVVKVAQAVGV